MREAFESEAAQTGKDRLLITMAVPASLEYAEKGFDVESLNYDLDFFNLLTYDYHSSYEPGRTTKPVMYYIPLILYHIEVIFAFARYNFSSQE